DPPRRDLVARQQRSVRDRRRRTRRAPDRDRVLEAQGAITRRRRRHGGDADRTRAGQLTDRLRRSFWRQPPRISGVNDARTGEGTQLRSRSTPSLAMPVASGLPDSPALVGYWNANDAMQLSSRTPTEMTVMSPTTAVDSNASETPTS